MPPRRTGEEERHIVFIMHVCALSTPAKPMTPLTEHRRQSPPGLPSLARVGVPPGMHAAIPQFHDGICEHGCGWMSASAWICSTWDRAFGEGACSRHCCSTQFSLRCCAWPRTESPLTQPFSVVALCYSNTAQQSDTRRLQPRHGRIDVNTRAGGLMSTIFNVCG